MVTGEAFKKSLTNLKMAGIDGKATSSGYIINYKGKKFTVSKDFAGFPSELMKYKQDIENVFGGRAHGAISKELDVPSVRDGVPYREGHIENKYVNSIAQNAKGNFNLREEEFIQKLKNDLNR